MNSETLLKEYHLRNDRGYRYLRIPAEAQPTKLKYHRDDPIGNVEHYKRFESILQDLDFNHKQLETLRKVKNFIYIRADFSQISMKEEFYIHIPLEGL